MSIGASRVVVSRINFLDSDIEAHKTSLWSAMDEREKLLKKLLEGF